MTLCIGVMSGTSMDAVDIALVELAARSCRLVDGLSRTWPAALRERLQTVAQGGQLTAAALAELDAEVGAIIAQAIVDLLQQSGHSPADVSVVGCHGQTVAHLPGATHPTTLQLGDANLIAEHTGITTINDFRRRDMAAGGQGAPLAPAFHAAMLRSANESRVVLNLGGIANITVLPAADEEAVTGFDTGPANCLMDAWNSRQRGTPYDTGGAWAAAHAPDPDLLARMLTDPYFAAPPPKSTGTQYFSPAWLKAQLGAGPQPAPGIVQATLLALTVRTVTDAIHRHARQARRTIVCGGGAENLALIDALSVAVGHPVESSARHGIDPRWVEPMAFAWLGQRTLQGLPGNLPGVTGAGGPRILGSIHPA